MLFLKSKRVFRNLYYRLPVSVRFALRRCIYFPYDVFTSASMRQEMVPPKGMIFTGSGDFKKTGDRLMGRLQQYAALQPHSRVLDIGCGIGRIARPLTKVISPPGNYDGFDVVESGINWCNKHITSRYPHFHFLFVDLANDLYKTHGTDATAFHFPYPDKSKDMAFAFSVFTHMMPGEVSHYLKETARVLEKDGKLFATFFIQYNQEVLPEHFPFPVKKDGYALMSKEVKAANILFEWDFLEQMIKEAGFDVQQQIPGRWNNPNGQDLQDSLVLIKQ